MAKVLFVDDEPDIELLTRQKFRKQIASGAFEILFAQNGQIALDLIKKEPDIAVVVSDVNMPEMDGLTLLDKLKELSPATKTIVVSAYGDTKTLRSAMNKGVFDFVTKPVDFNELGDTILRTLALYEPPSSPLYTYQRLLAADFPKRIDLSYPHGTNTMLWDAFLFNSEHIIVCGVSVIPSSIPLEIAISTAHGVLRVALHEDPNLSLGDFEKKLASINSSLKAHVIIGQYHLGSHVFSFKTNGKFSAHHITSEAQTLLKPAQSSLLNIGDVVTLKNHVSSSHLSLSRIHKA